MDSDKSSLSSSIVRASMPYVFVLSIVAGISYYALNKYNKNNADISERLRQFELIRTEEERKIREARELERSQNEENFRQLQLALEVVKKKHEEDLRILEEKRSKEITRLMSRYGTDTSGMTEQVSRATGFPVYVPGGGR